MEETKFYVQYPIRKSRFGYKKMRLFYIFLGLLWIGSAIYFYHDNPTGSITMPIIYVFIGLVMEVMAFYNKVIYVGKYVNIDNENLEIFMSPLKEITLKWNEISSIKIGGKAIELHTSHSGVKRLNLSKLDERQWKTINNKLVKTARDKNIDIT